MRRIAASFFVLACFAMPSLAAEGRLMPDDGSNESILIVRVSDGKAIYESNSKKPLIPASVTKVLTSAAALHYFNPAHTFKTRFYVNSERNGDTFTGSLYVKGDGDPLLTNEKLWQFAADLKNLGILHFGGDLVIDNSLFDDEERDSSRMDRVNASDRAYDAPVTAFGLNFNTLPLVVSPGARAGAPAKVGFDPYPLVGIPLNNQTITGSGTKSGLQAVRQSQGRTSSLTVSGNIGQQSPTVKIYRSMGDPVYEAGEQLRAFLLNEGISIKGRILEGSVPKDARLLQSIDSFDLGYIVHGLNHFSNNYIADALVKRLGAAFPPQGDSDRSGSGTLTNGVQAIARFMRDEVGIKDNFEILNGSGLDNRNKFSADQIVKVLLYMQKRMDLFPEYLASFPASGWSGTLKKRFKGKDVLDGMVRAKTGTLTQPVSVSSIAGFMGHPKHGMLAFAILNNGKSGSAQATVADFRLRQDRALKRIWEEF